MGYTKESTPDYLLIDEGVRLEAQLIGCGEVETPFDDRNNPGNKERRINFTFKITEQGLYEGQRAFGQVPLWFDRVGQTYKAGRKYFAWAAALLDTEDIPDGVTIENEDLLDTTAIIEMGVRTRKNKETEEEVSRNYVKAVYSASESNSSSF